MKDPPQEGLPEANRKLVAAVVGGTGVAIMLVALDIIPQRLIQPTVPSAVLFVIGLAPALLAGAVLFGVGRRGVSVLVAAAMFGMALAFSWIAIGGEARQMSGGIPFLPAWFNTGLARVAFGLGGLFFFGIGVMAARSAIRPPEDQG